MSIATVLKTFFSKKESGARISITLKEKFRLVARDITPVPKGKKLHLFIIEDKNNMADIFIESDDMGNSYPGWGERISYLDVTLYADEISLKKFTAFLTDKGLKY